MWSLLFEMPRLVSPFVPLTIPNRFKYGGHEHRSTDQTSVLEIVVGLLRCAEGISVHENLEPAQRGQVDNFLQCDTPPVQAGDQLRSRGQFEKIEWNGAATCADHSEAAPPRERGEGGGERRIHSHAIQDERRPDAAALFANLLGCARTRGDSVIGAVLAGQLLPGLARIDGDNSGTGQEAKELDRIQAQTTDADHDRGTTWPDPGKRWFYDAICRDAGIRERRRVDRV